MARKNVKEESDFHGRVEISIAVQFGDSSDITWICGKLQSFPNRKESTIKDNSIWQQRF